MDATNSFGYWLRRRRKALDLTQADLAHHVGCSVDLIQKIEADARRPSRQVAERLATCLRIEPAEEREEFVRIARAEYSAGRLVLPSQPVEQPVVALPQGTITFLFTDIEGSSRLWEQYPRAMPAALARHDALLKEIVAAHSGGVFKTVGDSVLAAFDQARDALAAALAAQRAISTEKWALPEPPRVRMTLHTGSAEVRAGDYFGPALNRAARLLAAGHGGQILLSQATEQLVREELPPNTALRDLGRHQLKDLSLPEQIYQLLVPDLPATFPALHTLDTRHTNLPAQPTALLGREQEVAAVTTLVRRADVRLVTLTGPGGIGKTRLGVEVAGELVDGFAQGMYLVDLAPISDADLVIGAVAATLGVREVGGRSLQSSLQAYLRDKHTLLLLDNFEQVLPAASLVADLLASAPRLTVLVTSREALRLRGEQEFAVSPLALPDRTNLPPLDQLAQYAAVALFIQRALAVRPDFRLTTTNGPTVAEICAWLDGLPLAIELAAARIKLFAPEALLSRLSSRLTMLSGGARDLPVRQQTMRSTIAWSYELLNDAERILFRRLGVFVGGCTLEAAETIYVDVKREHEVMTKECGSDTLLMIESLTALVDKSLVQHLATAEEPRFVMLETIRAYALEQLETSGEAEQLRQQHAHYYLAFGETIQPEDRDEDDSIQTVRLDRDYDNLWAALAWSQTAAGDPETAVRLTELLEGLWYYRGVWREAVAALERTLNHPRGMGHSAGRLFLRLSLGQFLVLMGRYPAAREHYRQALLLARGQDNLFQLGLTLERLGWLAREQGDTTTATAYLNESLAIFRMLDNWTAIAHTLNTMAEVAIMEEDPARAEALLIESRSLAQQAPNPKEALVWTLNHLGHVAQLREDYDAAMQLQEESLALFLEQSENWLHYYALHDMGQIALAQRHLDKATDWLGQALILSRALDDLPRLAWCAAGLGTAAALNEQPERAARLWGAAEKLREAIGCRPAPAARATYEQAVAKARSQLVEDTFAAAWAEGQAMDLEQAVTYALQES